MQKLQAQKVYAVQVIEAQTQKLIFQALRKKYASAQRTQEGLKIAFRSNNVHVKIETCELLE